MTIRPLLLILIGCAFGIGFLASLIFAVTIWPLSDWPRGEALALLDVAVGGVGFALAIGAGFVAVLEYEKGLERPSLAIDLDGDPFKKTAGYFDWATSWRITNSGRALCQWFGLDIEFSSTDPSDVLDIQDLNSAPGHGGQWSVDDPTKMRHVMPRLMSFRTNGEIVVWDKTGEQIRGPTIRLDALKGNLLIKAELRGLNATEVVRGWTINPSRNTVGSLHFVNLTATLSPVGAVVNAKTERASPEGA